jgi:threonine/homoserine/homoserine lactone efflux protein
MTLHSLALFAGAIFVLFMTPGPGNAAMIARTLDRGPAHGAAYGLGILTGDIFWLTVAITGLSAASQFDSLALIIKFAGAGVLLWFAWNAFNGFLKPKPAGAPIPAVTKRGLAGTYLVGITMPLSNPKAIVFYLSFLPAFFDLSQVTPVSYAAMIAIMLAMFVLFAGAYVGLAHRARDFLLTRGFRRWADLATALVMLGVALLLLLR